MPADNCSRAGYGNAHTFFQIDTTADDVFDLTVTDVYFADTKLICIWMWLDILDHTYYHMVKTVCQVLDVLNLNSIHSQIICKLFHIHIFRDIYKIFNP